MQSNLNWKDILEKEKVFVRVDKKNAFQWKGFWQGCIERSKPYMAGLEAVVLQLDELYLCPRSMMKSICVGFLEARWKEM